MQISYIITEDSVQINGRQNTWTEDGDGQSRVLDATDLEIRC